MRQETDVQDTLAITELSVATSELGIEPELE